MLKPICATCSWSLAVWTVQVAGTKKHGKLKTAESLHGHSQPQRLLLGYPVDSVGQLSWHALLSPNQNSHSSLFFNLFIWQGGRAVLGLGCCVGFSLAAAGGSYSLAAMLIDLSRSLGSRLCGLQ